MGHHCGIPGCDEAAHESMEVTAWVRTGMGGGDFDEVQASVFMCPAHLSAVLSAVKEETE